MPYSVSPQRNLQSFRPGDVEAQVELLALHAAELGHDEVAQLVDEDHEPQSEGDHQADHAIARLRTATQHLLACPTVRLEHLLQARFGLEIVVL